MKVLSVPDQVKLPLVKFLRNHPPFPSLTQAKGLLDSAPFEWSMNPELDYEFLSLLLRLGCEVEL